MRDGVGGAGEHPSRQSPDASVQRVEGKVHRQGIEPVPELTEARDGTGQDDILINRPIVVTPEGVRLCLASYLPSETVTPSQLNNDMGCDASAKIRGENAGTPFQTRQSRQAAGRPP
jgi:hypothetical protein